ncbi:PEP-CTERM sorting domain-containing protein [Planctomycetota bacterium]|nr:PEP-CTERM sorting domain-containing protein [Planctomycetota bacterium]
MRKLTAGTLLTAVMATPVMANPTGGFMAVLDVNKNHTDAPSSVVFYDTTNMTAPMFAVTLGFENGGLEDPDAMTIDKATGNVYIAAFDSGTAGGVEVEIDGDQDTTGDIDLFKIDFSSAYNQWVAGGMNYTTYGSDAFDGIGSTLFDSKHTNPQALPGVVNKIGEVARTNAVADENGDYTDMHLEFVDENNLLLIDGRNDNTTAAGDHQIRVLNRVSATAGQSNVSGQEGGYNRGTSESWQSKQLGLVNLEYNTDLGEVAGSSDIVGAAYVNKDGVQGLWIVEDDGEGDDVAFFEIGDLTGADNSLNKYKGFNVGGGPDYPTQFALDDDPTVDPTANDGTADKVFVDPMTGNLVIVESGFFNDPQHEPKVIVREIDSYNDDENLIDFGAWQTPVTLDTSGALDDDSSVTDGRYSAYDPYTNTVYFYDKDGPNDGVAYNHDWYALNLTTGQLDLVALDADASTGLYGTGDQVEFFQLAAALLGDFNNNGMLEAADIDLLFGAVNSNSTDAMYDVDGDNDVDADDVAHWIQALKGTVFGDADLNGSVDLLDLDALSSNYSSAATWEGGDFNGDGTVNLLDLDVLSSNYGFAAVLSAKDFAALEAAFTSIPEPTSLALLGLSGLALLSRRSA